MRIVDFIFGEMTLYIPDATAPSLIFEILCRSGANYRHMERTENGVVILCPKRDGSALCRILRQKNIEFTVLADRGIHLFFQRTRLRPGLYLGFFCFLFLILFSTQFVFDIRISGNTVLTDTEVLEELAVQGFSPGSYLPKTDIEALCNRVVLHSDNISWISVNILGTVAHVEIKERKSKPTPTPDSTLSCLVAARDGVIVGFDCTTGKIAVNVGETVKKGQLLVNGVTDTALGTYYGNAAGAVRARTKREISITIPKSEQVICGYERTEVKKSIIFLGKTIKIFTKGGNLPSSCDTMRVETKQLSLTPELLLPIFVETTYYATPVYTEVSYTAQQAERLALEAYLEKCKQIPDLQILSCTTRWEEGEEGYTLVKVLDCIENIAKKVPIQTN